MWIEKLTLYGFSGITNEQVELSQHNLNSIVEASDFGQSPLAEGIWATLFDFPDEASREAQRPWEETAPFKAVLQVVAFDDRRLQVERNFDTREVAVIDLESNTDVTADYLGPQGEDMIGQWLTGMSREMFRGLFILHQANLVLQDLPESADISRFLTEASSQSSDSNGSTDGAIEALNEALSNYTFASTAGRQVSVEEAISELEELKVSMHQKLTQMEEERAMTTGWLADLDQLSSDEEPSSEAPDPVAASEYDAYRIELKELSMKLDITKKRYEQKLKLEEKLRDIDMTAAVSSSVVTTLQDLWTRRSSRQEDANKLADEIQPQQEEYERLEQEINERYKELEVFSSDEANSISALAVNMYKLQQELNEMQKEHQEQTGRHMLKIMQSSQLHGTALEVLKGLSRAEIEEARNYASLLHMFNDQIQEEQKKIQEVSFSLEDIEERRKGKRNSNLGKSIGAFVLAVFLVIFLVATHDLKEIPQIAIIGSVVVMLISILVGLAFIGMVINFRYYLKQDHASAQEEEQKHKRALNAVRGKIANLEAKLTGLAAKTGCRTKEELISYINEASSHENVVAEQETLDQSLGNEEARMNKIQRDLAYFFQKAGRDPESVNSQRAMDLAQDISTFYKEKEMLETQFYDIRNARKQLDFLINEIADIDREITSVFTRSGVRVEGGLQEKMEELLKGNTNRQTIVNEIARVEFDLAGYDDPAEAINDMEYQKEVLNDRIQNLINDHPGLRSLPEPNTQAPQKAVLPWGEGAQDKSVDKQKKQELIMKLRTVMNNRDENYLEAVEELAVVDHDLLCARRAKVALEMARNVILELSGPSGGGGADGAAWIEDLNTEAESLINSLNMDVASISFSQFPGLLVKLKGYSREFNSADIATKLSAAIRGQIHWLARIILARVVAKRTALPIVLDEPFTEADDNRFLNSIRFLINNIAPETQVILLSCHQQRHQWVATQLSAEEQERISFITRTKLEAGAAL